MSAVEVIYAEEKWIGSSDSAPREPIRSYQRDSSLYVGGVIRSLDSTSSTHRHITDPPPAVSGCFSLVANLEPARRLFGYLSLYLFCLIGHEH